MEREDSHRIHNVEKSSMQHEDRNTKNIFVPLSYIPVICIFFKLPHWNVILVIIFLVSILRLWGSCSFSANTTEYAHFPYENTISFLPKKKKKKKKKKKIKKK